MSNTLNQIDELRKRASVSYTDAKEALESCNGDMLEALVYLEKNKKTQSSKLGFFDKIGALIKKGNHTRWIMHKQDKTIFNISVNIAILITFITLPFVEFIALGLLVALFTGHRFKLESSQCDITGINRTLDKVCDAAEQIKENLSKNNLENKESQNQ
jgi:hypothetical protein